MALTRNFLKSMGLTEEQVSAIIENHTDSIDGLKAELATARAAAESVDALTRERDDYKDKLSKAGDAAKVQADFDAYKQQVEADKAHAMDHADLLDIAKEAGVQRASFQSLIARDFDRKKIQRGDDGEVSNRAELVQAIKTGYPDCIASIDMDGTPPAAPPSGGAKTYTREQLRGMSAEEINRNWDAVSKSLSGLK